MGLRAKFCSYREQVHFENTINSVFSKIYFINIFQIQSLDFLLRLVLRRLDFALLNLIELIRKFFTKNKLLSAY